MDAIDRRVDALINGPLGCEFLLNAEVSGLSPAQVVEPAASFELLFYSVCNVTVWDVDYEEEIQKRLVEGPRLRPLAGALLREPGSAWWFGPLRRQSQQFAQNLGTNGVRRLPAKPVIPDRLPTRHERYGQIPWWGMVTSTEFDGVSSFHVVASRGGGDFGPIEFPLQRYRLTVSSDARIFTVNDPADWRHLCVTYPAPEEGGLVGGLLVPDFVAVAQDWDGMHISFGGLLTSEQVQLDGPEGKTEFQEGDAEHTIWLRWVFDDMVRLPDLDEQPRFTLRPWTGD